MTIYRCLVWHREKMSWWITPTMSNLTGVRPNPRQMSPPSLPIGSTTKLTPNCSPHHDSGIRALKSCTHNGGKEPQIAIQSITISIGLLSSLQPNKKRNNDNCIWGILWIAIWFARDDGRGNGRRETAILFTTRIWLNRSIPLILGSQKPILDLKRVQALNVQWK